MEVLQDKGVPLLEQEGWTRHQENAAKHPLKGADGVVSSGKYLENDHPVCAALERELFLMAQPPILFKEGIPSFQRRNLDALS